MGEGRKGGRKSARTEVRKVARKQRVEEGRKVVRMGAMVEATEGRGETLQQEMKQGLMVGRKLMSGNSPECVQAFERIEREVNVAKVCRHRVAQVVL